LLSRTGTRWHITLLVYDVSIALLRVVTWTGLGYVLRDGVTAEEQNQDAQTAPRRPRHDARRS